MTVVPYKDQQSTKKEQVAEMFNQISHRYDFLNHLLSLGIDIRWRKKAIRQLREAQPKHILDLATGTGDFALESLALKPEKVTGIDISAGMLEHGRKKMKDKELDHIIDLQLADSENLPFDDNNFDAAIVAFGVRNFENLDRGLGEMHRVLKDGGKTVILEFSKPEKFPMKQIYNFYFKAILPKIGRIISGDSAAYTYLPDSVNEFPYGEKFLQTLTKAGFKKGRCIPLTFGISSIYVAEK